MPTKNIETPLTGMQAPVLAGKKMALVSILRAGNGLLDGILELIPKARVGFVGLYRDEETLKPVQYYFKVPTELATVWSLPSIQCWPLAIPASRPLTCLRALAR